MSTSAIANRYAKALVELATEEKLVEQYGVELNYVSSMLARENDLRLLMLSPALDVKKKLAIMQDITSKLELSEGMRNFIGLLTIKGRLKYIGQIYENYSTFADEIAGVVRAYVTSAFGLTKAQASSIQNGLEKQSGKKIDLHTKVDISLLGGLKAEVGGRVFDGSIKTQLQRIEDTLKKG